MWTPSWLGATLAPSLKHAMTSPSLHIQDNSSDACMSTTVN